MPDVPGSPSSITVLQAVLTFSGALFAPVIGTIVGLLSRSGLQRRQQEAEYNIKRLELLDKAISVGKSLSNVLSENIDISLAHTEYMRVLNSLSPPTPPALLPFERHSFPLRLLVLPRPSTIGGWIASFVYYIYGTYAILALPGFFILARSPMLMPPTPASSVPAIIEHYNNYQTELLRLRILVPATSLVIAAAARFGAIRAAKGAAQRERERLQREIDPSRIEGTLMQKS